MQRNEAHFDFAPAHVNKTRHTFLHGWKEIAQYIGRGVRTVQRWEALGLPVRRPNARLRSAVVSVTDDIDAWLETCGDGRYARPEDGGAVPGQKCVLMAAELAALKNTIEDLRAENRTLRKIVDEISTPRSAASKPGPSAQA